MTVPDAWPFLIARGRVKGYRILLAPDFLSADDRAALLRIDLGARENGQPTVTSLPGSPRQVVAWAHLLADADLAEDDTEPPLDEAGRPLRLTYGVFVDAGDAVPEGRQEILDVVLATYRDFLSNEPDYTRRASQPLRHPVATPTAPEPPSTGTKSENAPTAVLDRSKPDPTFRKNVKDVLPVVCQVRGCLLGVAASVLVLVFLLVSVGILLLNR